MSASDPEIRVLRLDDGLPKIARAHATDAGIDLYSAVDATLPPLGRQLISTGIAVAIPEGLCGMIVPRSGRAINEGLSLVNSPGIIDSGYRGEIKVVALNTDASEDLEIVRGERIAQLVITPFVKAHPIEVDRFDDVTERSEGGFGSTGKR